NLWFTQPPSVGYHPVAQFGRITTAERITLFTTTNVNPNALAAGPDGQLWFTDATNNQVGKFVIVPTNCQGPTIVCPSNISVPFSPDPLVPVTFSVTATDDCDPAPVVTTSIASGSGFPIGVTTVTATAQDFFGKQSTCSFTVTRPSACQPTIVCPNDISVPCSAERLVPVTFSVSATDTCDPAPVVTTSIASGSGFPAGVTTVTAMARDFTGGQSTCSFSVTRDPLGFDGFAAPIGGADATGGGFDAPVRTFKLGSVIPVKFTASCGGSAVTTGVHTLQAIKWT